MNINSVSQVSCKANMNNLKRLSVPLKDGTTAKIAANENYFECLITKGENVLAGSGGVRSSKGLYAKTVKNTIEQIKNNMKEGFEFFDEFCKAIIK